MEEVVHRDVPLTAELEPVTRVPPVGIEVPVRETGELGKGTTNVLEYHEEDQEEGDHERKE